MPSPTSHLDPAVCYVCGHTEDAHIMISGHVFWSNAEAKAYFVAEDQKQRATATVPSMTAVETFDPREAVVA